MWARVSARSGRGARDRAHAVVERNGPDAQLARGAVEEVERREPGGLHARGATSLACIEPEMSVASTTAARSSGTATVASGRARAIASAVSATPYSTSGRWRRNPGCTGATEGSSRGEAKRSLRARRRRSAST